MGAPFSFGARSYRPPISIPGWDFPVGRTSQNSLNVAVLGSNIPSSCSWSAGTPNQFSVGASGAADFTISDWDFRGLDVFFYCQFTQKITFDNCLFDLSNFSTNNTIFLGARSGTPRIELKHCTFRGLSSLAWVTAVFGQRITLIEYCDVQDWPSDIINPVPITGVDTVIRYNWFRGACSAPAVSALHADFIQKTFWNNSGQKLQIYGNRIEMVKPQIGSVGLTGIFNLGSQDGNWNADVEIYDNYLDGGGSQYPIGITDNTGFDGDSGSFTGSVSMTNNYITGIGSNAFYPAAKIPANMTVSGLFDALTGAAVTFNYKNNSGSDITGATSIP